MRQLTYLREVIVDSSLIPLMSLGVIILLVVLLTLASCGRSPGPPGPE